MRFAVGEPCIQAGMYVQMHDIRQMEPDKHTYTLSVSPLCAILGDGEENGLTWQVYICALV